MGTVPPPPPGYRCAGGDFRKPGCYPAGVNVPPTAHPCGACGSPVAALDAAGSWACLVCCQELLVDPQHPRRVTLGMGWQFLGGGIVAVAPHGERAVLLAPMRGWIAPAVFGAAGVLVAALVVALIDVPYLRWAVGAVVLLFCLGLAAAVHIMGTGRTGVTLVLDAAARACRIEKAGRPVLYVPAAAVHDVYVWRMQMQERTMVFHQVMVQLAGRHLRIAEEASAELAAALARRIAAPVAFPCSAAVRATPSG